jgi:hypothetical protein
MNNDKQCPYRFNNSIENDEFNICIKEKCRFWTSAYTTENIQIFECAKVIEALKNSDGRIPV